ncbi:hypothetical protein [Aquisphaera insulae]|uniref:hypothetical protein n=1 Tax=Aquisphaera insulae TaxID=2712864 RepID=UPI0013ED89CA|nr:hypothetical protein [Aquisphaera insulae]
MESPADRPGRWALPGLVCVGILIAGCSEELGPERFETTRVRGRVLLGGKPVGGGFVDMLPAGGTRGLIRSTRIGSDGRFDADRVPVGVVAIRIVGAPIPLDYAMLFSRFPTRIQRTIDAHASTPIEIELMEEAIRAQATHEAQVEESRANQPPGTGP